MAEKTVIEHLKNIENKLDSIEFETVNEKLGCSFEDVVKTSKVYYEVIDLIRFNRDKKNTIVRDAIVGFIVLLPLIIYLVLHFVFDKFTASVLNYLPALITFLFVVLCTIRVAKRKPKQAAVSFWNHTNSNFYIFENELRVDKVRAPLAILMIIFKVLIIIFSLIAFGLAFKDIDELTETFDLFIRMADFIVCESAVFACDYSFTTYDNDLLFETNKFIVRKSGSNYTKEDK